jgi:hypothetical protein
MAERWFGSADGARLVRALESQRIELRAVALQIAGKFDLEVREAGLTVTREFRAEALRGRIAQHRAVMKCSL